MLYRLFMRLNFLLAIVALALGYATCKNFQKAKSTPNQVETEVQPAAPAEPPASSWGISGNRFHTKTPAPADNNIIAQYSSVPERVEVPRDKLPPASTSRKAFFSDGWWHFNNAQQPTDTTVYKQYTSKWLKFYKEQQFDIISKGKVVDTGWWNFDEANKELYLSCQDPYVNNTWKMLEKYPTIVLLGNTALNVTGIQIRVVNTKNQPPAN
jgi:hypothetical protein